MVKFALCFLLVCLLGCAADSNQSADMYFELNEKLVDKKISDSALNIRYQLPSAWTDLTGDSSIQDKLKEASLKKIAVKNIVSSADGASLLAILDIRQVAKEDLQRLKANYSKELNSQGQWSAVKLDSFAKDGFDVLQFVMANKQATQFQLLFFKKEEPRMALNFFTAIDSSYQRKTKIFESIIASIKSL